MYAEKRKISMLSQFHMRILRQEGGEIGEEGKMKHEMNFFRKNTYNGSVEWGRNDK